MVVKVLRVQWLSMMNSSPLLLTVKCRFLANHIGHLHCQLWDTGARAHSTSNCFIFLVISQLQKF